MKYNNWLIIQTPVIFTFIFALNSAAFSQHSNKKSEDSIKVIFTKQMMEEQKFRFKPQSASAMKGGTRQLSTGYFLLVNKDSLSSDLPYFGRAYQAPMNTADGGIKLSTVHSEYESKPRKKGGWDVAITPNGSFVNKFQVTVFENGSASLNVSFNDRQPIPFRGNIEELKK